MILAITVCTVLIIAVITGICMTSRRATPMSAAPAAGAELAYAGRHTRDPFPDERDVSDPDGEQYAAALAAAGPADLATLARVRDRILALPPQETAVPDCGETQPIPHAVATWGATPAELADRLAAEIMGAA